MSWQVLLQGEEHENHRVPNPECMRNVQHFLTRILALGFESLVPCAVGSIMEEYRPTAKNKNFFPAHKRLITPRTSKREQFLMCVKVLHFRICDSSAHVPWITCMLTLESSVVCTSSNRVWNYRVLGVSNNKTCKLLVNPPSSYHSVSKLKRNNKNFDYLEYLKKVTRRCW